MSRRVLIVTSSYAPATIADMHRARQLAWELPALGWDVEILSPDSSYQQESCLDRDSEGFFAPSTRVLSVAKYLPRLFQVLGIGTIGWRALRPMRRAGDRLLRDGHFDLVYFSTTQFSLFLLGPHWKRRHGVPFVLDFHDPCYRDGAALPVWARRSFKHSMSRWLAGYVESCAVNAASGLVAVSREYIETLSRRYGSRRPAWIAPGRSMTIPFAVLPRDLEEAAKAPVGDVTSPGKQVRIVYVGAGGPIMQRAFILLCRTLAGLRQSEAPLVERLRIELYGTIPGWREGDRRHLAELAESHGVADLICEDPRRVSYRRSLELLLGSTGALILGVDEAAYMPSKLFTYAASGKPLLAAVRREGPAASIFRENPGLGHVLWFDSDIEMPLDEASRSLSAFLNELEVRKETERGPLLESFGALAMARQHAELFAECLREAE